MSFLLAAVYDRVMRGVEEACGAAYRRELLGGLSGRVLEIGAGTGRNLDHYGEGVTSLTLTEPDRHMRKRLRAAIERSRFASRTEVGEDAAERLPYRDAVFDAVVSTLVLCSVRDPVASLAEVRRVLVPGGRLLFLEHVVSEKPGERALQRGVEPVWRLIAGNCHLARDTARFIREAGFAMDRLSREDSPGSLPITRATIRGVAVAER